MMGVLTLFTTYKENNVTMVALEKDAAGVVSQCTGRSLWGVGEGE
jgi:hypothetical protein